MIERRAGAAAQRGFRESHRLDVFDRAGEVRALREIRRQMVRIALDASDGNVAEAARILRVGRSTLYRWLPNDKRH